MKLTGREAIEYAEANNLTLNKYNDPTEDAREGITTDEARKIAREDPSLIWLETTHMTNGMTRDEAIAAVGIETVDAVEKLNCDYSGGILPEGDERVEFIATVRLPDASEYETITAVYYQDKADLEAAEELDQLDWEIATYRVI